MILIIAVSLIFLYVKKENQLQNSSSNWLTTDATVVVSQMTRSRKKNSGAPKTLFKVELKYNYTVQDSNYLGERYAFHDNLTFNNLAEAKEVLDEYPRGKKISVYYMPSNPKESAIIR